MAAGEVMRVRRYRVQSRVVRRARRSQEVLHQLWLGGVVARQHDPTYRQIFSHVEVMEALLRDFVGVGPFHALDGVRMTRMETTFIAEALARQQSDMLWKVEWLSEGSDEVSKTVYVLLEFQSTIDPVMPQRMGAYVWLIMLSLAREQPRALRQGFAPIVFPIVLYNGVQPWTAPRAIAPVMLSDVSGKLSLCLASIEYYLIDEGRLAKGLLRASKTLPSTLFQIERSQSPKELKGLVVRLARLLAGEGMDVMRRDVLMWLREAFRGKKIPLTQRQISAILHEDNMLAQKIEKWFQEATEEGVEKGKIEGARELALKALAVRFGEDSSRAERVSRLDYEALMRLIELVFTAQEESALYERVTQG